MYCLERQNRVGYGVKNAVLREHLHLLIGWKNFRNISGTTQELHVPMVDLSKPTRDSLRPKVVPPVCVNIHVAGRVEERRERASTQ